MNLTLNPHNGRGCGTRSKGVYLCSGLSDRGIGIENFIIDPAIKWEGPWPNRGGFKIIPSKAGHNNVIIFISEKDYPSLWDFVEETSRFGLSRKVTPTFPIEQLIPGKSHIILAHRRTVPNNRFEVICNRDKPLDHCRFNLGENTWDDNLVSPGWHPQVEVRSLCTFAHKDIAESLNPNITYDGDSNFEINMPSFSYKGKVPHFPVMANKTGFDKNNLLSGLFLALPLTHIEFPHNENKQFKNRANQAGFETVVMEY